MKSFILFLLVAGVGFAQPRFATGQAARVIIGQPKSFTAQQPGASDVILGAVSGVAYANDTLFVADANRMGAGPDNHRVLLFNNLSSILPGPFDEIPLDSGRCPVCAGFAQVVLGQPDFTKTDLALTRTGMRLPTAVATDGRMLAVADTDNNRVLLWNSIPATNGAPADVVLGQANFTTIKPIAIDNRSFRGPQGVWFQNGKLFVADTQNHRVMIWNSIPSSNDQPADVVLGQPNFNVAPQPDLTKATLDARATTMLNPVAVTSDGVRLFVTDLGHNRVLIWNSIPTTNQAAADIVLGQPDFESAIANHSSKLCAANGKDEEGKDTFPTRCSSTLDFPRFALSDGQRLFISDGGNDRVLIFNSIPTQNGQAADIVLGQLSGELNLTSDNAQPGLVASPDTLRTPAALAWDGTNLYVSDPFNRRVLVFTIGLPGVPNTGVRNAASREIYAVGTITFSGEVKENDEVTLKIEDKEYKYKIVKDDSAGKVISELIALINAGAGDPNVVATPNSSLPIIQLTARVGGEPGNEIDMTATASTGATIIATTSGATLTGGQNAAKIAPGSIVAIFGENLSDRADAVQGDPETLPRELAGVQVYFDGIRAPLYSVTPGEITAQLPFEVNDATAVNAYVRTVRNDGSVTVTTAVGVPVIPQNPGIFAALGPDPRPGVVMHSSSYATGTVSVDGTAQVNDVATVIIEDREYSYTVVADDTLDTIRNALIAKINEGEGDPKVVAFQAGVFTRIRLRAKVAGPEGNNIKFSAKTNDTAQVILTPTNQALCCANLAGSLVTEENPALPGETIIVIATGLGLVKPTEAQDTVVTGAKYQGPELNEPVEFVSSLAGGRTANVLFAGLKQGTIGLYEVHLELNSDIPTNSQTQLTIAQSFFVSNIITFPVLNPSTQQ